jgi:hypothetical protein
MRADVPSNAPATNVPLNPVPTMQMSVLMRFIYQGIGFRVQGSGFRVQGSGFRVQGSGFGVNAVDGPQSMVDSLQLTVYRNLRILVFVAAGFSLRIGNSILSFRKLPCD